MLKIFSDLTLSELEFYTKTKILVLNLEKGRVKWYNSRKGFGFIISEEAKDIFVHHSALTGDEDEYLTLNENDEVEFDIVQGQKGPQASNVVVTKKAPPQIRKITQFSRGGSKRSSYKGGSSRRGSSKDIERQRSTKF